MHSVDICIVPNQHTFSPPRVHTPHFFQHHQHTIFALMTSHGIGYALIIYCMAIAKGSPSVTPSCGRIDLQIRDYPIHGDVVDKGRQSDTCCTMQLNSLRS